MKNTVPYAALFAIAFSCDAFANDDERKKTVHTPPPEESETYDDKLLGSMWGLRHKLDDHGVALTVAYKGDVWSVMDGGINTGQNYLDNFDARMDIDNEKLFGLEGNTAAIHFTNNAGGKPNLRRIGSSIGIDNIEVIKNAPILYEAWDQQHFFDKKLSLRVGMMDVNNEFIYTESGLNFLSPVQQLSQTLAQSGKNGPPTFPYTEPGARLKYEPIKSYYAQFAVFNGLAGDPQHLYGTNVEFDGNMLLIGEVGYKPDVEGTESHPNLLAIGGWTYTHSFNDLLTVDANGNAVRSRSEGLYALSSWQLYKDGERDLTTFFRPSMADGDTRQAKYAYEVGVQTHGFMPPRPKAEMGLAMSQVMNGDKHMTAQRDAGNLPKRSEYAIEGYYRDTVLPGITLQPDLQYIINPGTVRGRNNAVAVGMRTEIQF
ncbi:MAG: hypothetical protein EBV03_01005 [Proteobacteria bacterium]|nr:hypothetical protein [Pseudomonadota bacterium]